MIIESAEVVVTSPGRTFVTLRITTDEDLIGLGDATLNGRELAVASYLSDHVAPLLIGRDAHAVEDTWQFLHRGAYWRRGSVTMTAIAAVDVALWDLVAQRAGLPLYQLLGGASRRGLLAYGHAGGRDLPELSEAIHRRLAEGFRAIRVQSGVPGIAALHQIRSGMHGPTDVSPVGMAAALHLGLAIHNFGIQEYMPHAAVTADVFETSFAFAAGMLHPGELPGLGVRLDLAAAEKYPYQAAYLPVNRLPDGTVHDW